MTPADVVAKVMSGEHGDFVPAKALGDAGRGDRAADPPQAPGSVYFPNFRELRRCSEQAIVAVVLGAYVNGISTRKVDRLVEQL
jgi:hypothetical protein